MPGPASSTYLAYDRQIRDAAIAWLGRAARERSDKPWCLFVSFVCPHFPLVAPPEFYALYPLDDLPLPRLRAPHEFPDHPVLRKLRAVQDYEDHFRDETHVRMAIAAYYGMVSFLDDNIGQVLRALDAGGLREDTLVVYTSDHGDNLGSRTFWGKSNMYEEAVGVPLILRGRGVPRGRRVETPVSLVDGYPTILEAVGVPRTEAERCSARQLAPGPRPRRGCRADRVQRISRRRLDRRHLHGALRPLEIRPLRGLPAAALRPRGRPRRDADLAGEAGHEEAIAEGLRRLRAICDPAEVTARAFADQERRVEDLGGVEVVRKMGSYPYTPAPGEVPRISP